jgi:DNA-directed RNA polymerase specialized sigma24 family protein
MQEIPVFHDSNHQRAYLYKALRNRWISTKRPPGRDATTRLAAIEFDTVEAVRALPNRNHLFFVREDLSRVCEYVLIRRASNKCATAFALHHFCGIPRPELCRLLKMNKGHLTSQIGVGRLEAKAYIERPHVLLFLRRYDAPLPDFPLCLPESSDDLFLEIQRRIFFRSVGAHDVLNGSEEDRTAGNSLTLLQTAHLGSCRYCLEQRKIQLATLTERRQLGGQSACEDDSPRA